MVTAATIFTVCCLCLIQNTGAVRPLTTIRVGSRERGREDYKAMPLSTKDNKINEFQKVKPEPGFKYSGIMDIFCLHGDPRLCLCYDKKGNVVCVQISYIKSDADKVDQNLYNFGPNYIRTNFFGIPAYTVRIYLVNPDKMTAAGRNCTSRDIMDGLWAEVDGELLRFDYRCQPNSPVIDNLFFMQGCVDKTGQVYSRKFHEHSECKNAFWLYLLYENRSLVGFGHAAPSFVSPGPDEDVYNHPIKEKMSKQLLPDRPRCYYDLAKYDFSSVDVFLIEDPWNIRCPKCLCQDSNVM
ncbi:uncharacterized protein [Halyomorpha halys]|uniref:uncharacterized protein isoform X2 n=1 Tax=Halyomorpha halys TaxID=286706 RepID=UPI0006D4D0C0|nr:uncharacterized protein LOC106681185 isoform X2 [Halyomorpha halys]